MTEKHHYPITIKESHVDSYGHLNNATYLMLFEEARWEIVTPRGFGYFEVHKLKQGPVILEIKMKFMKEVLIREDIIIETEFSGYKGKIGQMVQRILKKDGTLACEAEMTFGLFDMNLRKLIEPTPQWKKALGME
jgi:YbgC/YbaW family acyl-CoA thioester hydrolase